MDNQVLQDKLVERVNRLRTQVNLLREKVRRSDRGLQELRYLLEDRTRRLAGRIARLEGQSPAVQCQDGS